MPYFTLDFKLKEENRSDLESMQRSGANAIYGCPMQASRHKVDEPWKFTIAPYLFIKQPVEAGAKETGKLQLYLNKYYRGSWDFYLNFVGTNDLTKNL